MAVMKAALTLLAESWTPSSIQRVGPMFKTTSPRKSTQRERTRSQADVASAVVVSAKTLSL